MSTDRTPSILIPYGGVTDDGRTQDVFVLMRPETNGIIGEKVVMNTIRCCPEYAAKEIHIVYLANIPSDTLIAKKIYERYHALKIHFATRGGAIFTPAMRRTFSAYFNEEFDAQRVIGAFPALNVLSITAEELFAVRVGAENMLTLNGQSIKKYKGYFIVNYNAPALVHRYSLQYDIAVMCFRMDKSYDYFEPLTQKMRAELIAERAIAEDALIGSAFHYSHGPFDQLRDGASFLLNKYDDHIDLDQLSFARYLRQRQITIDTIEHLIINPIVIMLDQHGDEQEVSICDYTRGKSYAEAYEALTRVVAHSSIDPLGLIITRNKSPAIPRVAKISATK